MTLSRVHTLILSAIVALAVMAFALVQWVFPAGSADASTRNPTTRITCALPHGGLSPQTQHEIAASVKAHIATCFYRPFETGGASATTVVSTFDTAIPDLQAHIVEIRVDGDAVTGRTLSSGQQNGTLLGVPATNRFVQFRTADVHHFSGRAIANTDHLEDLFGLYNQITS